MILGAFWRGYMVRSSVPSLSVPLARVLTPSLQTDGVAGLTHAFCDTQLSVWGSDTFPRYTYLFYISKYYECVPGVPLILPIASKLKYVHFSPRIVDTAILLLKGKKVGMLQSYHHTGAIWTMFAGYRAQAMPIWLFCVFSALFSLRFFVLTSADLCHLASPLS